MLYLGVGLSNKKIRQAALDNLIGIMDSPNNGEKKEEGIIWAADNGCFNGKFEKTRWQGWLERQTQFFDGCIFATVPDKVADHKETIKLFREHHHIPRNLGYPVAFVAQNGATPTNIPWDEIDVIFIGGDTAWKMGTEALRVTDRAKENEKKIHVGRVNGYTRYHYWYHAGADTVDGSMFAFAPEKNLSVVLQWEEDIYNNVLPTERHKVEASCHCGKKYDSVYKLNGHKRLCKIPS